MRIIPLPPPPRIQQKGRSVQCHMPTHNGPMPWCVVAELFEVRTGERLTERQARTLGELALRKLRRELRAAILADDPYVKEVMKGCAA